MKISFALFWALFLSAIGLITVSALIGESQFGLFLIFPFVIGSGPIAMLGIALLFFAMLILFASFAKQLSEGERPSIASTEELHESTQKKYGGVVMIGPLPIAFGSDSRIAMTMMIAGIIIFLVIVAILILSMLA